MPEAIVLLGPSGSGKTPLGMIMEKNGVADRRAFHIDFGASLRSAAAHPEFWPGLSVSETAIIRHSLETGALLEAGEFPVALKILRLAALKNNPGDAALAVLNGIPRHIGQAVLLESIFRVVEVVSLECPMDILPARIMNNSGGDRKGRSDDAMQAVKRRWEVFKERTRPLLDHYASRKIPIIRIPVSSEDTGETLYAAFLRLRDTAVTFR